MSAASATVPDTFGRRAWRRLLRLRLALHDRRRYERVVLEHVDGLDLVVLPDVFNPVLLRSGAFLLSELWRLPSGATVLDLGCGSGAGAIAAAVHGCTATAVDINPSAVRCTKMNALLNDVQLDVRRGDLFSAVSGERFDVVLFNPPYYRGRPRDSLDHAWRSQDVPERFATDLPDHLAPRGYALMVLSSDGDPAAFLEAMRTHHLEYSVVARKDFINEVMSVYRVAPA